MLWQLEYTHPIRMYAGHEADVDIVKFHPNCNYIATASSDKTVRLWSHADAKMVGLLFMHFIYRPYVSQSFFLPKFSYSFYHFFLC